MFDRNEHNGWTNYATWRVNLELIDGMEPEWLGHTEAMDHYDFGEIIEEWVQSIMDEAPDGFVKDYANAFLSDVDWNEIAKHKIEEYADA
jgi:hypothetical protein